MKRILCLHGKQQNKEIFRPKLGRIPPKLKQMATMTIIDGPFDCPDEDPRLNSDEGNVAESAEAVAAGTSGAVSGGSMKKSWFDKSASGVIDPSTLQVSLDYIQQIWKTEGPFDGILGFSMGGTLAAILASQQHIDNYPGLKFLICIGAPNIPELLGDYVMGSEIRSLHIAGANDTMIPVDRSQALANRFTNPVFYVHPQGHCIPTKAENITWITDFVQSLE